MYNLKNKRLLPFKFKKLSSWKMFLSTDYGDFLILTKNEFKNLVENKAIDSKLEEHFIKKNILLPKNIKSSDVINTLAWKWLLRHHYLLKWTSLHIIVVTLWCNQSCQYCHASAPWKWKKYNMTKEQAKK